MVLLHLTNLVLIACLSSAINLLCTVFWIQVNHKNRTFSRLFHSHKMHLLAFLGLFTERKDTFYHPLKHINWWNAFPFINPGNVKKLTLSGVTSSYRPLWGAPPNKHAATVKLNYLCFCFFTLYTISYLKAEPQHSAISKTEMNYENFILY